jgi:hypothetical protein
LRDFKSMTRLLNVYFFQNIILGLLFVYRIKNLTKFTIADNALYKKLEEENCSLIRWGDGETGLLFGRSTSEQRYTKELAQQLKSILSGYRPKEKLYLAIPVRSITSHKLGLLLKSNFALTSILFTRFMTGKVEFGDAFLYRTNAGIRNFPPPVERIDALIRLGNFDGHLIVVSPDVNHLDIFKVSKSSGHISIPRKNSFDFADIVEEKIKTFRASNPDLRIRVIISAGPLSKILVHRLYIAGIQAIDVGVGLDQTYLTSEHN